MSPLFATDAGGRAIGSNEGLHIRNAIIGLGFRQLR